MIDIQKSTLERFISKWTEEIQSSAEKCTTVNISDSFEKIFSAIMVLITFGEDISEDFQWK